MLLPNFTVKALSVGEFEGQLTCLRPRAFRHCLLQSWAKENQNELLHIEKQRRSWKIHPDSLQGVNQCHGLANSEKRANWMTRYVAIYNRMRKYSALGGRSPQRRLDELLCSSAGRTTTT